MSQYTDHEDAVRILKEIEKNPSNYLFIHYSCESFIDIKDGRTPRITSIAIRHIKTGQTESFSLHKVAEQAGESIDKLHERYDIIERKMLDEYFEYLKGNKDKFYLHINMWDINYGFKAIEHRFKVLKCNPFILHDSQ